MHPIRSHDAPHSVGLAPICTPERRVGASFTCIDRAIPGFSVMEKEKMKQVGRDPQTFLDKGIRLHCDKVIDRNVYKGFDKTKSTGLCNNPDVIRTVALPATSGGTDTQWAGKTADQILRDVNQIISDVWTDNDCSSDALPNHILVPVEQFGALVTRKVSDDSERSILTYVLENNLSRQQGGDLIISPASGAREPAAAAGTGWWST